MKILDHFEQGSLEWFQQRVGKPTMSQAKTLITGGKSITRRNYILDLAAERLSGMPSDTVATRDMERGNFLEPYALESFTLATKMKVRQVGFVLTDDERVGCSPDGLIGEDSGLEIKCPRPRQHIRNIFSDGLDDYRDQAQGNMWICEREFWYLVSYCPWVVRLPIYIKRIVRNEDRISLIRDAAIKAADEVDELVAQATNFNAREDIRAQASRAADRWDNVLCGLTGVTDAA